MSDLVELLNASSIPIYVVDDRRRIVYGNAALFKWTGQQEDQLVGQRCDYHSGTAKELSGAAAFGLCPPPQAFAGQHIRAIVAVPGSDGQLSRRSADFYPLSSDAVDCPGVIAILGAASTDHSASDGTDQSQPESVLLHEVVREFWHTSGRRYGMDRLAGEDPSIARVRDQVSLAMGTHCRVLIVGPPGSGREHVARTIHYGGQQTSHPPLLPIDCHLMDGDLLESVFNTFQNKSADLESGERGTVLLLELDRLPDESHRVLLNLVKSTNEGPRIITTASVSVFDRAEPPADRDELVCALGTLIVELPSLANRAGDIPIVAQVLLEQINADGGNRQLGGFTPEALDRLASYNWPRNVEELNEMIVEAYQRAGGPLIALGDLPPRIHRAADAAARPLRETESIVLDQFLEKMEAELVRRALRQTKGNKTKAAELLGMNRARLHRRMVYLDITSS